MICNEKGDIPKSDGTGDKGAVPEVTTGQVSLMNAGVIALLAITNGASYELDARKTPNRSEWQSEMAC